MNTNDAAQTIETLDEGELWALYAEFAQEDRELAEVDLAGYARSRCKEDEE